MPTEQMFKVKKFVDIAQDSRWSGGSYGGFTANPKQIFVHGLIVTRDIDEEYDQESYDVHMYHSCDWTIYSDTAVPKMVSDLLGINVGWSEQGMQSNKIAHLEAIIDIAPGKEN